MPQKTIRRSQQEGSDSLSRAPMHRSASVQVNQRRGSSLPTSKASSTTTDRALCLVATVVAERQAMRRIMTARATTILCEPGNEHPPYLSDARRAIELAVGCEAIGFSFRGTELRSSASEVDD